MSSDAVNLAIILRKKIRSELNNLSDDIANGVCASFDDYKFRTGIIYGLGMSERMLLDTQQQIVGDMTEDN